MQLVCGSYTIDGITIDAFNRVMIRSDRGYAQRLRVTLSVRGELLTESQGAMTAAMEGLLRAVSADYADVVIKDDDGNVTPFKLLNSETIDGVKLVQPPTFTDLGGAIYALRVPFSIAWEADFKPDSVVNGTGQPNVLEYGETLTFSGNGGPLKAITLTPRGEPIESTLALRTPYFATQSGSIRTLGPVTSYPRPIWPEKLVGPASSTALTAPVIRNGVPESYGAQWSYQFQSITPLVGLPTVLR